MPQVDPQQLVSELERFDPTLPIEKSWMPPSSWYTQTSFLEIERQAVFLKSWQPAARTDQLASPGDYVSGSLFGNPWVAVRNENGEIRAFHNVCRHKGREVVRDCGHTQELVCGYHAWKYGLDGGLKSAPKIAGIQDFDKDDMRLTPLRCEVWGPWLFVNADPAAVPLAAGLKELDVRLNRSGWNNLKFYAAKTWRVECNWKVYADNYLDGGYHIPHMHPTLDAQIDMERYKTELFDRYSIQSAPPNPTVDSRIGFDAHERIGDGAIYAWLFPNFTINRYGPCMDSNYIVPRGTHACDVVYEFYFAGHEEGAEEFVKESIAQADLTQQEDIDICESVQRGLASSAYDRGRYAPRVETGEHHFHCLLYQALAGAMA